jgi:hypothetical protein
MIWTDLGKFLAAFVVTAGGAFTMYSNWDQMIGQKAANCENKRQALFKPRDTNSDLDLLQEALASDISTYENSCDVKVADKTVRVLFNSIKPKELRVATNKSPTVETDMLADDQTNVFDKDPAEDLNLPKTPELAGWVALGRVGGTFGQINFDGIDLSTLPNVPTSFSKPIKARWAVNLRTNPNHIKLGNNPIVDTLQDGDCVLPKVTQLLKGQIWALVSVVDCQS